MLLFINYSRRAWQSACIRTTIPSNSNCFYRRRVKGSLCWMEGWSPDPLSAFGTPNHMLVLSMPPFKWVLSFSVLFVWDSGQELFMHRQPDIHGEKPVETATRGKEEGRGRRAWGRKWRGEGERWGRGRRLSPKDTKLCFHSFNEYLMSSVYVSGQVLGTRDLMVSR